MLYEVITAQRDLGVLAKVISASSVTSLKLKSPLDAEQLLDSLHVQPDVVSAYLFDANRRPLAAYLREVSPTKKSYVGGELTLMKMEEEQIESALAEGADTQWSRNNFV